jgi:hypothetical protein
LEADVDDRRTDRGKPYMPKTPETGADGIVAAPSQVSHGDVIDALLTAICIFAIFYLGSLAQRMGAR